MPNPHIPGAGLQLYTLRNLGADFETLVRHTSEAGYGAVETFGPRPEHGARLLYDNHDFELRAVDGRSGLDRLLGAADPESLGLEPDLGWIARAGGDPAAVLARHVRRRARIPEPERIVS